MLKKFLSGKDIFIAFEDVISEWNFNDQVKSILVLTADGTVVSKDKYDTVLLACKKPVLGGIFPEIVFEGKRYSSGTIMIGLPHEMDVTIIRDFSSASSVSASIESQYSNVDPHNKSLFIFSDCLIKDKSFLFDTLFNLFGSQPNYIGAGAGSLKFETFPCVYTNQGVLSSVAIVGIYNSNINIGVAHGWQEISEPLKVTEAESNRIISLDWKPAMEVYKSIIESHSGKLFDYSDFISSVKSYPFGISKLDSEMVVRDPFMHEEGSIYVLDKILQGSFVRILYGNKDLLIKGAKSAFERANEENLDKKSEIFIVDCISRVLFLDENYQEELNALDPDNTSFGVLSLGEIANNGDTYLEVYNKTAVVSLLHE